MSHSKAKCHHYHKDKDGYFDLQIQYSSVRQFAFHKYNFDSKKEIRQYILKYMDIAKYIFSNLSISFLFPVFIT